MLMTSKMTALMDQVTKGKTAPLLEMYERVEVALLMDAAQAGPGNVLQRLVTLCKENDASLPHVLEEVSACLTEAKSRITEQHGVIHSLYLSEKAAQHTAEGREGLAEYYKKLYEEALNGT